MGMHGFCPLCGSQISQQRYLTGHAICKCGWFDKTPAVKADLNSEKKTIIGLIATAVLMVALYAHMVNWGSHSLSIPIIKVKQLTGTLSSDGYLELADACVALNKWSCAKNAYMDLYKKKQNPLGLAKLGRLNARLGDEADALNAYGSYFKVGGNDGEAALEYGKLLEASQQYEAAYSYYEASIQSRPEVLPIQATSAIVRMMMKHGRYEEAYQRILAFHESAQNAAGYLNTELAQLENHLGKSGKRQAKRVSGNGRQG